MKKMILIAGLAVILAIGGYCYSIMRSQPENVISDASFTSHAVLKGSTLTITYPPEGFYGHGAKVTVDPSIHIEPTAAYVMERGSEFVVLDAGVTPALSSDTSAKAAAMRIATGTIDEEYAKKGNSDSLNGHEYFLYKVTEDVTVWKAVTVDRGNLILVAFAYKPTEGEASKRAYQENDTLFKKILAELTW